MPNLHPKRLLRPGTRSTAVMLVALALGACRTWVPTELGTSRQFLNGRTRVYQKDGRATIVDGPRIEGDSIVGRFPGSSARVAVARADVERIEAERLSRGRTAIVGIVLMTLYYVAVFSFSDSPQ